MAEQTFRSPGFFEREIELFTPPPGPSGTPAGVIGVSRRGPAFVPVTVGSFSEFTQKFGDVDPDMFAPYAVQKFLENRTALTFLRVLGAGANKTNTDISNTQTLGTVKSAGFRMSGSSATGVKGFGAIQYLAAEHTLSPEESFAYPIFTDNDSFPRSDAEGLRTTVRLIRGMLMTTTGSRFQVMNVTSSLSDVLGAPNIYADGKIHSRLGGDTCFVTSGSTDALKEKKFFKLVLISDSGKNFAQDEKPARDNSGRDYGNKVFTVSLDPGDENYIARVLNTDPGKFGEEEHLLYADFPVEHSIAPIASRFNPVSTGDFPTAADALDVGAANGSGGRALNDEVVITYPAEAGGTGTAITIRIVADAGDGTAGERQVFVRRAEDNNVNAIRIIAAINGNSDANYAANDGAIDYGAGAGAAAGGIPGITAKPGQDAGSITIQGATQKAAGNGVRITNGVGAGFLNNGTFTGGVDGPSTSRSSDTHRRTVALLSGSAGSPRTKAGQLNEAGLTHADALGRFDTRYTTPRTTSFISQPFGKIEYNLFHFETLDDGIFANTRYKVSISNLRASTDEKNPFGTFEVLVRSFNDTDKNMSVLERYSGCTLDPDSDDYVAKKIGDVKVFFDFDQVSVSEQRLRNTGRFANVSSRVRIVMAPDVENRNIPEECLPFGFRGIPVLKTCDTLTDRHNVMLSSSLGSTILGSASKRMFSSGAFGTDNLGSAYSVFKKPMQRPQDLTSSIVPPMPFRHKVTMGASNATLTGFLGKAGDNERVDSSFFWGISTSRIPRTSDGITTPLQKINAGEGEDRLVTNYAKFLGIAKCGALVTGSAADEFNNNKFTLARVALPNRGTMKEVATKVTGSASEHMLEAFYIRNGIPNVGTKRKGNDQPLYSVLDPTFKGGANRNFNRYTMATLLASSSIVFNRFTEFAKFTNIFYGGFDGLNIFDKDMRLFRDRALSSQAGQGKAASSLSAALAGGLPSIDGANQSGVGRFNNNVASLRTAINIMTEPTRVGVNILAIPGARDPEVTDHALARIKDYQMGIYVMDTLVYDKDGNRLYDDVPVRPDVRETSEKFESRGVDNNYAATFFPDVHINDTTNDQIVQVPASVAALSVFGFNDREQHPWFAPAGFNRGSLNFVRALDVRLNSNDRDVLYDARINPIASFPRAGFVMFGQKTLQRAKSALDRINVRRLMVEIKRQIVIEAEGLLFEPNTAITRGKFIANVTRILAGIQAAFGIERFNIVMDDSNNSREDVLANRLNGRIVVVPTRAVEFIAVDFIITNDGVEFV